jgi:glutamyl-tRNA synthetase
MADNKVRVRFAPSPTGPLHIGGVRTALYNYLFAKKQGGDFILRIEDTDQARFVPGAEEYIIESFQWCGIQFNEGVTLGGPHAPYRQSERKEIYRQYAEALVKSGNAYYAFDTSEELDKLRKECEAQKKTFNYNFEIRKQLKTSLHFGEQEALKRIENGEPWVIRFQMSENVQIKMIDLIRGAVTVNSSTLDDKVLFKSADGLPTYHLANIVDDYLMNITHVIRGEEWLPSLPLHVMLYRALGWESSMPLFAHLPLLLKPDGKGKLSKRDGDKLGFPVFPLEWKDPASGEISSGYRESGYLPEAVVNFLALLGWNPGNDQELFTMEQLIEAFSIEHVHKAGAKFDFEKAKWFNHHYIQQKSDQELAVLIQPELEKHGIQADPEYVAKICGLVKNRINFVKEIWQQGSFFFVAPETYDQEVVKKRWKDNIPQLIGELRDHLKTVDPFTVENIKENIHHFVETKQANMGAVMNSLRLALVGGSFGPDLPVIIEMLGKDEVVKRIQMAIDHIHIQQ